MSTNCDTSSTTTISSSTTTNRVTASEHDDLFNQSSFGPLSFSNSLDSISSIASSILPTTSNTNATYSSVPETIETLLEKCDDLKDILTTDDLTFSHIRDIESLAHRSQLVIDACQNDTTPKQRMAQIQQNLRNDFFHAFENNTQYNSQVLSIVKSEQKKTYLFLLIRYVYRLLKFNKFASLAWKCINHHHN